MWDRGFCPGSRRPRARVVNPKPSMLGAPCWGPPAGGSLSRHRARLGTKAAWTMATKRLWSVLSSGPRHASISCYPQHNTAPRNTLPFPLAHANTPCARAWGHRIRRGPCEHQGDGAICIRTNLTPDASAGFWAQHVLSNAGDTLHYARTNRPLRSEAQRSKAVGVVEVSATSPPPLLVYLAPDEISD